MPHCSHIRFLACGALALCLTLSGPAYLAAKGEGRYSERRLGEKDVEILEVVDGMDEVFRKRGYVLQDDEATALLQEVCSKVLVKQPVQDHMEFQFRIIRDPLPNAFAMPNGSVYFTTGMLGALTDEAQLASICAHETNHVLGHHTFVSMKSQRKKTAGAIAGSMILGTATASVGGIGGELLRQATGIGLQVLYMASIAGYSRDLEEEADRRAVQMVVEAGYDPRAMPEVFEILGRDYEGLQIERKQFWLSHPKLDQRIAYIGRILDTDYADTDALDALSRGEDRYRATMEDVARHNVDLLIKSGLPRTALAMANALVDRYGEGPENLILLGKAWVNLGGLSESPQDWELSVAARKDRAADRRRKTREERDQENRSSTLGLQNWETNRAHALEIYERILKEEPGYAPAHRGLGILYEKSGDPSAALEHYGAYLEASPEAIDRFVIERHMKEMQELAAIRAAETGGAR